MSDLQSMMKNSGMIMISQLQKKIRPRQLFAIICIMSFIMFIIHAPSLFPAKRRRSFVSTNTEALKYRPEQCYNCNIHDFQLLINSETICQTTSASPGIHILILISSVHKNRAQRDMYRDTWLTYTKNNTADIRYAFIFGNRNDTEANTALLEESKLYNDILQEDFYDSYTNLSIKTMMAFKWASTHCAHAQYLMKTDDDMYVNIPGVKKAIKDNWKQLQTSIGGKCFFQADPVRDLQSKWYVSYQYYAKKFYPGYCSGTGYVTSMTMVTDVFKVSKHVPFFYLEDVFVSLCVERIGKQLLNIDGFNSGIVAPINSKVYKSEDFRTAHRVAPKLLLKLWNDECQQKREIKPDEIGADKTWTDC